MELEQIWIHGQSQLSVWRRGLIERFLREGLTLWEAQLAAIAQGGLVYEHVAKNLVVTRGKALTAKFLINEDTAGLTYHALGTGVAAPAIGDIWLGAEQTRKAITLKSRSTAVITLSTFFTGAESTYNIKECGIFGGASATATTGTGFLFSRWLQAFDNSSGSYDLTYDYQLTVS